MQNGSKIMITTFLIVTTLKNLSCIFFDKISLSTLNMLILLYRLVSCWLLLCLSGNDCDQIYKNMHNSHTNDSALVIHKIYLQWQRDVKLRIIVELPIKYYSSSLNFQKFAYHLCGFSYLLIRCVKYVRFPESIVHSCIKLITSLLTLESEAASMPLTNTMRPINSAAERLIWMKCLTWLNTLFL